MPCRVSVVTLMTFTRRLPRFAYSTRYIAEKIPVGTAISSDRKVMYTVLIIAGIIDILSVLYSHANSSGLRCTTPFMSMYIISENSIPVVITADSITSIRIIREPGLFLYVSQNCCIELFLLLLISQPSFSVP